MMSTSEIILPGQPGFKATPKKPPHVRKINGLQATVHICRDGDSPALCGAFSGRPPRAWPAGALWVRLDGKIYLSNCHRCHTLAGCTEAPGEWR